MKTSNKRPTTNRARRPLRRLAEAPRLHRGRERNQCATDDGEEVEEEMERPARPRRSRKYNRASTTSRLQRQRFARRPRLGDGEELMDLDLDEILEVDEDEIEEVLEECPPGCVPEEEEAEEKEEDEGEEDEGEEDEGEEKEASVGIEETDESEEKEASVAKSVEIPVEAPKEAVTTKWAPLYSEKDLSTIGKTAEVVMVPFFEQEDPAYVVLAKGRPVGELRRSDLNLDEDHEGLFTDDSFVKGVIGAVEQLGADNVLGEMKLRYYAAQVTQRQADAAAKASVQADMEEAFQSRVADLKEKFFNNAMLAIEASMKNVWIKNPLREAVRAKFHSIGTPDAVTVGLFEEAMQEAGAQYLAEIMKRADEWLGMDEAALQQIEQAVKEADYSDPVDRGLKIMDEAYSPREAASIPVRTMAPPPQRQAAPEPTEWDAGERKVRAILRGASTLRRGSR